MLEKSEVTVVLDYFAGAFNRIADDYDAKHPGLFKRAYPVADNLTEAYLREPFERQMMVKAVEMAVERQFHINPNPKPRPEIPAWCHDVGAIFAAHVAEQRLDYNRRYPKERFPEFNRSLVKELCRTVGNMLIARSDGWVIQIERKLAETRRAELRERHDRSR